jgi:hypothetical protein
MRKASELPPPPGAESSAKDSLSYPSGAAYSDFHGG